MYIRNNKIFTIACSILLISACSNDPSIKSASSDKVIIGGPPEKFTAAFELARVECQKHTKIARYIPDNAASLSEVTFNCEGPETETTDEVATTSSTEETTTEQTPTETAEASAESDDVSAQETQ
ncbi:MAG: hypothetical protein DHS20C09_12170 [marine bacterium B5-7]|nr:MAG: hypothetical protein DHS20C09_12170 [marine bacterium B5-7]